MVVMLQLMILTTAQVTVVPNGGVVAGLGGDAVFTCISSSSSPPLQSVEWLINGTLLNSSQLIGATQEFLVNLRFRNVPREYNNSKIQCLANMVLSPESSTLLVQGLLSAVGSVFVDLFKEGTVHINWTAPFTLDISTTQVDITYCVDVVSSTSSATLHSECGITETEFTYPLPPRSWCHEYNFTVTPVNIAGNGTSTTNKHISQDLIGPELLKVTTTNTSYSFLMSSPLCEAELRFEDINVGDVTTLVDTDLTIARNTITFNSQLLRENRKYQVSVLASNVQDRAMSTAQLSTHDIISTCSIVQDVGNITVVVNFTEHSEATGALLNFIFINEDGITINFTKSRSLTADRASVSQGLILPLNMWYPGQYMLYAYDIESDKKISNGLQYEANNGSFMLINGKGSTPPNSQNCSINSHAGLISITCSFLMRFQVTAQLNSLDCVNVLHVNTSTDPYTATLQVHENGEYLVTVFPIQNMNGILSGSILAVTIMVNNAFTTYTLGSDSSSPTVSEIGIIASTVVTLLVAVVAIVIMMTGILCLKIIKSKKGSKTSHSNAEVSHIIDTTQDTQTHQQNLHTMDSLTTTEHEVGTSHNMNAKGCDEHICASHQSKMSLSAECLAAADNTLTPPCPTPLSDEGQNKLPTAATHYSALHHAAVSGDTTNIHNIEYAVAAGFKTKQNQLYTFVDVKESDDKGCVFTISKGINDDVVYSEIPPQAPGSKSEPENQQEQQMRVQEDSM